MLENKENEKIIVTDPSFGVLKISRIFCNEKYNFLEMNSLPERLFL